MKYIQRACFGQKCLEDDDSCTRTMIQELESNSRVIDFIFLDFLGFQDLEFENRFQKQRFRLDFQIQNLELGFKIGFQKLEIDFIIEVYCTIIIIVIITTIISILSLSSLFIYYYYYFIYLFSLSSIIFIIITDI